MDTLKLVSLQEEPDCDHLSRQEDKDQYSQKFFFAEDKFYREIVRGIRLYMGWSFIPALKHTSASSTDNTGTHSQPVAKCW